MKLNKTFSGDKVPTWTKWVYPGVGIGRDSAYTMVNLFFMTYIQYAIDLGDNYALKMGVIAVIMIFCLLWDGIDDPMIGSLIENTHFKWGKYKPWIFIGALTNSICLALMFTLRPSGWAFVALFGVFYLVWEITFTFNDIAYWSMLPSLSSDERERTQLTTLVSVAASIGAFAVGGLVPVLIAGDAVRMYNTIAIVVAIIFFLSQMLLVFTCKEHERNVEEEAKQPKAGVLEMFKVLKKNNQLGVILIVILVYYLGSALLNAFGLNYFYFSFDYEQGGSYMFIFTVVYAIGTILAQAIFPLLNKKWNRSQLLTYSFIAMIIGYTLFFFVGDIGTVTFIPVHIVTLSLIGIFIFVGSGIFYLDLLVMMTNTIEYNEWKNGDRREGVINAIRPLTAKVSSAMQQGIVYLFLFASGIYTLSSQISKLEVDTTLSDIDRVTQANILIFDFQNSDLGSYGMTILKIGMCVIPMALFTTAYILIRKKYTIDEKKYALMRADIASGRIGPKNPHFDEKGKEIL